MKKRSVPYGIALMISGYDYELFGEFVTGFCMFGFHGRLVHVIEIVNCMDVPF